MNSQIDHGDYMWQCPHCGYENEIEERIALKEICARCKNQRIDEFELMDNIEEELYELDIEKGYKVEKMEKIDSLMNSLRTSGETPKLKEADMPLLEQSREDYKKQFLEIEMRQIELKNKIIYTRGFKRIYKDQKNLSDFGSAVNARNKWREKHM